MSKDRITITIPSWDKFNPRKDLKTNPWFRLDREIISSPDLHDQPAASKWAMVAIMALCCRKAGYVTATKKYIATQIGITSKELNTALQWLEETSFILVTYGSVRVNESNIETPVQEFESNIQSDVRYVTERNVTRRNETERDETRLSCQPAVDWADVWNSHCGSLPKINSLSKKRTEQIRLRLLENPDPQYWISVFQKLSQSSFAISGNWASFDWLIKNDTNHAKVSEGNYDDKPVANSQFTPQPYMKNPLED